MKNYTIHIAYVEEYKTWLAYCDELNPSECSGKGYSRIEALLSFTKDLDDLEDLVAESGDYMPEPIKFNINKLI